MLKKSKNDISPITRPRLKTAKIMGKSKTVLDLSRPISSRPKEVYTLSRLLPRNIIQDKEKLYEENMQLKLHSNEIIDENLQLRTKIKQLELKKKKYEDQDPSLTLVSSLKATIKELKDKIGEKENEIHVLRKNIRLCKIDELEIEIKMYEEECLRLSSHLNEFMKIQDIPSSYLEYENKIYNKTQVISKLKKEAQDMQFELNHAKEEIINLKDRLLTFERKYKKGSPKNLEINLYKEECETLKAIIQKNQTEYQEKEKNLLGQISSYKETLEKESFKMLSLQKELQENFLTTESLKKQISYYKDQLKEPSNPSFISSTARKTLSKEKNPPRLFIKINELSKEKCLLVSILLSLLDENNNGYIESEELCKGIVLHEKPIKKKYVDEVIKLMSCTNKSIPLKALESWYDKYDYDDHYSSSSEEEVVQNIKPVPEKFKFIDVKPDPKYNQIVIPTAPSKERVVREKEKEIPIIKVEQISHAFERIRLYMQFYYLPQNKMLSVLFGNSLNPDVPLSVKDLAEVLKASSVYLGSEEDIMLFSRFIVEPEKIETLTESALMSLKSKVMDFSRKIKKHAPEWKLIDKYKAHQAIYPLFFANQNEILSDLHQADQTNEGIISLNDFKQILYKYINIPENSFQYLYILSYSISKKLDKIAYIELYNTLEQITKKILDLKQKHSKILETIEKSLEKSGSTFENVFGYNEEFLVSMDTVVNSLKTLEVDIDENLLSDINCGKFVYDLGLLKVILSYN
jgi:hypothetical protein